MATDLAEIGEAIVGATPTVELPRQTELPQAFPGVEPILMSPAATPLAGHDNSAAHNDTASQNPSDDGQCRDDAQCAIAIVGNITMQTRRYADLRRAHQRLLLQAMATCRYLCDGDKVAGAKLFNEVKEPKSELALHASIWLIPYFEAMKPLETAISEQEKTIKSLARQLPVWKWAENIKGLSERFLGLIVGECGAPVGEFKSVAAVWKRMGLAVINGGRQRRIAGDAAIEHGYVARRRSLMWNVGNNLIKAQVRKAPDDETKRIAIGELGQVYLDRKVYELERTDKPIIAHNRAKRYMEKRLLRELYKAWRAQ